MVSMKPESCHYKMSEEQGNAHFLKNKHFDGLGLAPVDYLESIGTAMNSIHTNHRNALMNNSFKLSLINSGEENNPNNNNSPFQVRELGDVFGLASQQTKRDVRNSSVVSFTDEFQPSLTERVKTRKRSSAAAVSSVKKNTKKYSFYEEYGLDEELVDCSSNREISKEKKGFPAFIQNTGVDFQENTMAKSTEPSRAGLKVSCLSRVNGMSKSLSKNDKEAEDIAKGHSKLYPKKKRTSHIVKIDMNCVSPFLSKKFSEQTAVTQSGIPPDLVTNIAKLMDNMQQAPLPSIAAMDEIRTPYEVKRTEVKETNGAKPRIIMQLKKPTTALMSRSMKESHFFKRNIQANANKKAHVSTISVIPSTNKTGPSKHIENSEHLKAKAVANNVERLIYPTKNGSSKVKTSEKRKLLSNFKIPKLKGSSAKEKVAKPINSAVIDNKTSGRKRKYNKLSKNNCIDDSEQSDSDHLPNIKKPKSSNSLFNIKKTKSKKNIIRSDSEEDSQEKVIRELKERCLTSRPIVSVHRISNSALLFNSSLDGSECVSNGTKTSMRRNCDSDKSNIFQEVEVSNSNFDTFDRPMNIVEKSVSGLKRGAGIQGSSTETTIVPQEIIEESAISSTLPLEQADVCPSKSNKKSTQMVSSPWIQIENVFSNNSTTHQLVDLENPQIEPASNHSVELNEKGSDNYFILDIENPLRKQVEPELICLSDDDDIASVNTIVSCPSSALDLLAKNSSSISSSNSALNENHTPVPSKERFVQEIPELIKKASSPYAKMDEITGWIKSLAQSVGDNRQECLEALRKKLANADDVSEQNDVTCQPSEVPLRTDYYPQTFPAAIITSHTPPNTPPLTGEPSRRAVDVDAQPSQDSMFFRPARCVICGKQQPAFCSKCMYNCCFNSICMPKHMKQCSS